MSIFREICEAVEEPWADDAFFIFVLLVAGRRARGVTRKLEAFLGHRTRWPTPRELERPSRMVRRWWKAGIIDMKLHELRTGQYRRIGGALSWWAENGPDMGDPALVYPGMLEEIPGVGPRTARMFLLYRRPTVQWVEEPWDLVGRFFFTAGSAIEYDALKPRLRTLGVSP